MVGTIKIGAAGDIVVAGIGAIVTNKDQSPTSPTNNIRERTGSVIGVQYNTVGPVKCCEELLP